MLHVKYLNEAHLKGFEKYKYNSIDSSWLSNKIMHPFWNKCVTFFPTWFAPNLMTFSGFLLTVLNFLWIGYYDFDFSAADQPQNPIPRWLWIVAAINLFVAYTLDGIDGKQARRTGTSGPLGELFDHGLDSYSTSLIMIYMFSLFGRRHFTPLRMHFIILTGFVNFYMTHFEKYNTNVMFLPVAYDFVMWSVTLTLLLTTLAGAELWTIPVFGILPVHYFEVVIYISGPLTSHWMIVRNIYRSYKDKTGKMRPFCEAIRPLFPLTFLMAIMTIWAIFSANQILSMETRLFLILEGTLFSNICCRLIVAQMSDTRCDAFNALLWPTTALITLCIFPSNALGLPTISESTEKLILYILTGFVTLAHIHYGQGVVREMCDHFNIRCFKISDDGPPPARRRTSPASISSGSLRRHESLEELIAPTQSNEVPKIV